MATNNMVSKSMANNIVWLYNTKNIDATRVEANFSIRTKEYQRLWKDISTAEMAHIETHYIIQGASGAGKTTILTRLAHDVANTEHLRTWLVPIVFNEQEYGVFSLVSFWLRVAEKLAEHDANKYQLVFNKVAELASTEAELAWRWIKEALNNHAQKIIVLLENVGDIFDGFNDIEQAQLREVLSEDNQIRILGSSNVLLNAHFDGLAPFYQFFKLVTLNKITADDMHTLLRALAKQTNKHAQNTIENIIVNTPEQLETVRRLTDGMPRTIVQLFQIIMQGVKNRSFAYLEKITDITTPHFPHRIEALSRQQKVIVHTINMNWDAMSAKEIATTTKLPSKTVSAQLVKLQKQRVVVRIKTETKNHLYNVQDRFFNIWYLMRYGNQKDKQRVMWLTYFIENWLAMPTKPNKDNDILSEFDDLFIPDSSLYTLIIEQVLNNNFEQVQDLLFSKDITQSIDEHFGYERNNSYQIFIKILVLLLAKKQYEMVYLCLKKFGLQQKLKPIYYATLSFFEDERNNNCLRMGAELTETVNEVYACINAYEAQYI